MVPSKRPLIVATVSLGVTVVLFHLEASETGLAQPRKETLEERLSVAGDWSPYGSVNRNGKTVLVKQSSFF